MKALFFDTETTHGHNFKEDVRDDIQPDIVQFGCQLLEWEEESEDEGEIIGSLNVLTRPLKHDIHEDALKVHGITLLDIDQRGVEIADALFAFHAMLSMADVVVAHNYRFDSRLVATACHRLNSVNLLALQTGELAKLNGKCVEVYCTMLASTNILKIPGRFGYKWPRLVEAYAYFYGEALEGAHDAMVDVVACRKVFQALHRSGTGKGHIGGPTVTELPSRKT